jgi:UDP-N-acetylmuramate--alanine ligase
MLVTALRTRRVPGGLRLRRALQRRDAARGAGSNDWVVAEVDESDGTIDGFSPEITVIVNLDWDHPDRYGARPSSRRPSPPSAPAQRGTVLVSDACALSLRLAPARRHVRAERQILRHRRRREGREG